MGKSSNKPRKFLLPHLMLCTSTTLRDAAGSGFFPSLPTGVHTVQQRCLSAPTACETNVKTLSQFVSGCHLCLTQRLLLSLDAHMPTLLFCFTRSYRYCTHHSSQRWPEGPQTTTTETASQFSSLSKALRKPRKVGKGGGHKYSQTLFSTAKISLQIWVQCQQPQRKALTLTGVEAYP